MNRVQYRSAHTPFWNSLMKLMGQAFMVALVLGQFRVVFAQGIEEEQCFFFPTSSPVAIPDNWGSELRLVSPRLDATDIPRDARLVLGGFLFQLEDECEVLHLRSAAGAEVELIREGTIVRPASLLDADTEYLFSTDHCFLSNNGEYRFSTGQNVGGDAPSFTDEERDALVNHILLHLDCGGTFTTSVFVGTLSVPTNLERLQVSVRVEGSPVQGPIDIFASAQPFAYARFGLNILAQEGQPFRVAVSPVDHAGRVGDAAIFRLPARRGSEAVVEEDRELYRIESNACRLENALEVHRELPVNGVVQVRFPLEAGVYFLENDTRRIPMLVDDDLPLAQRLRPAQNVAEGETFSLVADACASCICPGCQANDSPRVTVVAADNLVPDAPEVLEILEDLEPLPSVEQCQEDRTALLVRLPASDDESLRYRASIRLEDVLPVQAGSNLVAVEQDDGTRLVRLETAEYGRLLPLAFELTLEVVDAADNQNITRYQYAPPAFVEDAGCSNAGAHGASWALFLLCTCLLVRPRRGVPSPL